MRPCVGRYGVDRYSVITKFVSICRLTLHNYSTYYQTQGETERPCVVLLDYRLSPIDNGVSLTLQEMLFRSVTS